MSKKLTAEEESAKRYREARQEHDRETEQRAKDREVGLHDDSGLEYILTRPIVHPNTMTRKEAKALALARGLRVPDYNAGCGLMGTSLAEHPAPYIRKFPNAYPRKRRIRVTQTVYWGQGHHYYTTMREQDNPIWSVDPDKRFREPADATGRWIEPRDDKDGDGIEISERCMSVLDADRWLRHTFETLFNPKTHVMVKEYSEQRWFYKDGD